MVLVAVAVAVASIVAEMTWQLSRQQYVLA